MAEEGPRCERERFAEAEVAVGKAQHLGQNLAIVRLCRINLRSGRVPRCRIAASPSWAIWVASARRPSRRYPRTPAQRPRTAGRSRPPFLLSDVPGPRPPSCYEAEIARGLLARHDHGSQYVSDYLQEEYHTPSQCPFPSRPHHFPRGARTDSILVKSAYKYEIVVVRI